MPYFFRPDVQRASFLFAIMLMMPILTTQTHLTTYHPIRPVPLIGIEQAQVRGPLRVNPASPRYFTDDGGNAILLTGSHTWADHQDYGYSDPPPTFDYAAYLDFLQTNRHNFIRLWVFEQVQGTPGVNAIWFTPSIYRRTGPGRAQDGQLKFDLTKFNQAYFDRLRSRIIDAGNRDIYVSIMFFNGFSVGKKSSTDPGNPWPGHPFNVNNNINGINGDLDNDGNGYETHTLVIPAVTAQQEAYVRKIIDTVNDLDNVLYEISNESNQDSTAWQYHMIEYIKRYEATKPKQHPVGMTVTYPNGNNSDLFNSPADWISPNNDGGYQDNPPAATGSKVIIVDTDHLWGIGGDRQWVWKSFTRGLNPIFMDCYDSNYCDGKDPKNSTWVNVRQNMGYILSYANRINLATMVPLSELCSTEYCLANPIGKGAEYLVYLPDGGDVSVDLSGSPVELVVEWFNPENGTVVNTQKIVGGNTQTFSAPFSGDAVLYIYDNISTSLTPIQTSTIPPVTQTPSAGASPSPTPASTASPLPCAQGLLLLSGLFFVVVFLGFLPKKISDR